MKRNEVHEILLMALGVLLGFLLSKCSSDDQIKTETVTVVEKRTDTVYVEVRDTVTVIKTEIDQRVIRDTVLIDYEPKIRAYRALLPVTYGDVAVSGEVLGEVLQMKATAAFDIPTVTNTIEKTTTTTIKDNRGSLYVGGMINQLLEPSVSATYSKNDFLFNYQYNFQQRSHAVGVSKKLFPK